MIYKKIKLVTMFMRNIGKITYIAHFLSIHLKICGL